MLDQISDSEPPKDHLTEETHVEVFQQLYFSLDIPSEPDQWSRSVLVLSHHNDLHLAIWQVCELDLFDSNSLASTPVERSEYGTEGSLSQTVSQLLKLHSVHVTCVASCGCGSHSP